MSKHNYDIFISYRKALKKCDVNTHKEIVFKVRHNYAQFLSGIQDHASVGEYYELAADILRNNPAEQAKFALESYLGGLNYSIAAKYEASNRMLNQTLSVYAQGSVTYLYKILNNKQIGNKKPPAKRILQEAF